MTMRRLGPWVATVVVLLAACGDAGGTTPPTQAPGPAVTATPTTAAGAIPPSTTPPTTTPPGTSTPGTSPPGTSSPPATAAGVVRAEQVDDLADWQVVFGPDDRYSAPAIYDGDVVVVSAGFDVYLADGDQEPRLVHRVPVGGVEWLLDDVVVGDGFLALVEHENVEGDYRVWRYDLDDLSGEIVEEWGGSPLRHVIPQIATDGERVAWTSSDEDGNVCIRVLAAGEVTDALCSPGPDLVLQWPALQDGALSYQSIPDGGSCGEVFFVVGGGAAEQVEVNECWGFQGAATAGFGVWMEMSPDSSTPFKVPVFGRNPDGTTTALGLGAAGSLTICEGRAYWLADAGDVNEIRSWTAGEDVRVVYRSGPDNRPTTSPKCAGGWVTIVRADTSGTSNDEVLAARAP